MTTNTPDVRPVESAVTTILPKTFRAAHADYLAKLAYSDSAPVDAPDLDQAITATNAARDHLINNMAAPTTLEVAIKFDIALKEAQDFEGMFPDHVAAIRQDLWRLGTPSIPAFPSHASDPMQAISDLGCENERIIAAFEMVAANLRDLAESDRIKPKDIYAPWMVLLVIIESYRAADQRFSDVEEALLQRLTYEQRQALKREG